MTLPVRSVFVDTGAYAALAVVSYANHRRAVAIAAEFEASRTRLVTSNFVLTETYSLILARAGRDIAVTLLDRLEQSRDLVIRVTETDEERARVIMRHYRDKSFTLVDATSFAVMERLGIVRAFTFDRHFAQYGFQGIGHDPRE